jgi:uncharacterized protein YbdZ (MbtH family)
VLFLKKSFYVLVNANTNHTLWNKKPQLKRSVN